MKTAKIVSTIVWKRGPTDRLLDGVDGLVAVEAGKAEEVNDFLS